MTRKTYYRTGSTATWGSHGKNTRTNTTTNYNRSSTGTGSYTSYSTYSPTKFNTVTREITCRIGSYRNLNQQFSGAAKVTNFSPTTANKWFRLVNDGNRVYKFTNQDFCKFFGTQWNDNDNPNMAYRWMKNKFGTGIKAVARGKGNSWLIAASPKLSARPFSTYTWK